MAQYHRAHPPGDVPHRSSWVTAPTALLPHHGLLSMGCSSSLGLLLQGYPWAVPHSGLIHCWSMSSSMTAHGDLLCSVTMGCRGTSLLLHGCLLGCKDLLLHAWNISCLPSALILGLQGCFSHIYSLLSQLLLHSSSVLFVFFNTFILKSALPEAHSVLVMAQAAATGATGAGCDLTWNSVGICWDPLLPKYCHTGPIQTFSSFANVLTADS